MGRQHENRVDGDDVLYDHEHRLSKAEEDIAWIKWLLVALIILTVPSSVHVLIPAIP